MHVLEYIILYVHVFIVDQQQKLYYKFLPEPLFKIALAKGDSSNNSSSNSSNSSSNYPYPKQDPGG